MDDEKIVEAVVNRKMYEIDWLEPLIPGGNDFPYIIENDQYHDLIDHQIRDSL